MTDDDELFAREMKDVRRLRGPSRVTPAAVSPSNAPRKSKPASTGARDVVTVENGGEYVTALRPGVSRDRLRELRRASPTATLDLHGMVVRTGLDRLERFIAGAQARGERTILVVTGRGLRSGSTGPVLRAAVIEALSRGKASPGVLAFVTAPPPLGGSGALLVLLRRR